MATFEAKVCRLRIEEHPNADVLELAIVGDYRCVVRKHQFVDGSLCVYIPEQSVLPQWLIEHLGLEGKLAGKNKNRVKAVKLRGILSQGLVYPVDQVDGQPFITIGPRTEIDPEGYMLLVEEGQNVAEEMGIKKYEPPIPVQMQGEVFNARGMTIKYDVENIKKYPNVFEEGEEVIITEKLHGTWCCFGYHPNHKDSHIITSKGLSAQGLAFYINENNKNNLYLRALDGTTIDPQGNLLDRAHEYFGLELPFYILGEVYGKGVQDLGYNAETPKFRVFDIYVGSPGEGRYMSPDEVKMFCKAYQADCVPELYRGPYSKSVVEELTSGNETVSGQEQHIREGVVIRPKEERDHPEIGRVILKSVSEDYLLRKGGTEHN